MLCVFLGREEGIFWDGLMKSPFHSMWIPNAMREESKKRRSHKILMKNPFSYIPPISWKYEFSLLWVMKHVTEFVCLWLTNHLFHYIGNLGFFLTWIWPIHKFSINFKLFCFYSINNFCFFLNFGASTFDFFHLN